MRMSPWRRTNRNDAKQSRPVQRRTAGDSGDRRVARRAARIPGIFMRLNASEGF
jgi:hypothetical protein